jgi:Secretion system C-terminal sorting domain
VGKSSINDANITFGGFVLNVVPWASVNSFLIKFDASGNPICGSTLENLGSYALNGIASDVTGDYIYIAGTFGDDTIKCGNDTLISNTGGTNIFVGRWLNCAADAGINPITSPNPSVTLFPNPNNGVFNVVCSSEQNEESLPIIHIYNILGEQVLTETLRYTQGDNSIELTGQLNGIYLYRVITETGALVGEGKVVIEK